MSDSSAVLLIPFQIGIAFPPTLRQVDIVFCHSSRDPQVYRNRARRCGRDERSSEHIDSEVLTVDVDDLTQGCWSIFMPSSRLTLDSGRLCRNCVIMSSRLRQRPRNLLKHCDEVSLEREYLLTLTRLYIREIKVRQWESRRDQRLANWVLALMLGAALLLSALFFCMRS